MLLFEKLLEKDIEKIVDWFPDFSVEQIKTFLSEEQNIAFVARLDGEIIGLIYGYSLTRMEDASPQFFIYSVDIHDAHQNKGYGQRFIKFVLDWAKENGYCECFVLTNKDNPAACRAYEKAGMEHSETDCERMYVAEFMR